VRAIRRGWSRLRLDWEIGLHRLPFFTQKTAVMMLAVLVATLALLGGVVSLVGMPGAGGPARLVPGGQAGRVPARPAPGGADATAGTGSAGGRAGAAGQGRAGRAPGQVAARPATGAGGLGTRTGTGAGTGRGPGAERSGGAAGAGAGGPPAAPPASTPPTTTTTVPAGPLPPLDEIVGPVVSTLLP
jgi:hypothetical protein